MVPVMYWQVRYVSVSFRKRAKISQTRMHWRLDLFAPELRRGAC
jgi:hypothetical protein